MFKVLNYERYKQLAQSHRRVVVYKELAGDRLTPANACMALRKKFSQLTLLESTPNERALGRFSHICFEAMATIACSGQQVCITEAEHSTTLECCPFETLREYQKKFAAKTDHHLSGFVGGMAGFVSYDAIRLTEDIPDTNENTDNIPDLLFRFYRCGITFDHQTDKVVISTVADSGENHQNTYEKALERLNQISRQLLEYNPASYQADHTCESVINIEEDIPDETFCQKVLQAKEHIAEGDIFQIVLSRKFTVEVNADPFDIYRALRFSNPSPYMFYLEGEGFSVAGASPEKLISVQEQVIESCPLAGTRPRDPHRDEALARELLADEKEVAEHMMLVDLARNDVGSIAIPGSVQVTKLKQVEKYSRVMHISSTVQGRLRGDKDVFDAIRASLPAGTLSGAPKISAMKLIDQLETSRRGIYGGAICAIDSTGNLDSCIVIRTAVIKDGKASVRAGAGVVFDSDPQAEADETRQKAKAILEGILMAEGKSL